VNPLDQLSALASLASVPRQQLEWLVAHGEVRRVEAGQVAFPKAEPLPGLFVVLSGRLSIRVSKGGMTRVVKETQAGEISGHLPYSRMTTPPNDVVADEPTEMLVISGEHELEMTQQCYDFTALCVHEMVDRARAFKSDDLQREQLASLGRLSAGLAHELNNPSSAVERSSKEMDACRLEVAAAARVLGSTGLSAEQSAAVAAFETAASKAAGGTRSALEAADHEDAISDWLADRGLAQAVAEPLASTAVTMADLDQLDAALNRTQLMAALRYVAANVTADHLTGEIVNAATRIHLLVAAIKKYTHMDRAPVADTVHLEESLSDTVMLTKGKARAKSVTLDLDVEADLPSVRGVVGELNEVWMQLVDNAIDAAPESGSVLVKAALEQGSVVVRVRDNGAGIPDADRGRIFEPFFTTKPVGQGSGLGLDVVQGIVRSHGGSVEVNFRPGCTEFRVSLPAVGASR
jgi:signal transduction histidine kinase